MCSVFNQEIIDVRYITEKAIKKINLAALEIFILPVDNFCLV